VLSHPASPGNVPTSAGIEDYNSMGATSARHARRAVELATHVVAIELQTMAEALDCQRPLRSGDGVERAHAIVRGAVPRLTSDRSPAPDIAAIAGLIRSGAFDRLLD
jgi:histidine ammonia-lyase